MQDARSHGPTRLQVVHGPKHAKLNEQSCLPLLPGTPISESVHTNGRIKYVVFSDFMKETKPRDETGFFFFF